MALRYLILTSHYRKGMNFTWSSIAGAQMAYDKLKEFVKGVRSQELGASQKELSREKIKKRLMGLEKSFWKVSIMI